jgi:hypothetical protein
MTGTARTPHPRLTIFALPAVEAVDYDYFRVRLADASVS